MTRKKFVKQLMGRGLTRNQANLCAAFMPCGKSYADYYREILWQVDLACMGKRLRKKFALAIKPLAAAVKNLSAGLMAAFSTIDEWDSLPSDTLHAQAMDGRAYGIDLAAGPDMTAYKPVMRLDSMVIDTGPVIPDLRKKTATELAEEIMEKLPRHGGGGHD